MTEKVMDLADRLERIEGLLARLIDAPVREAYTTGQVAQLMQKSDYTVREWCRTGRIRATKKRCGRGKAGEWVVAHDELCRVQNEGLLPQRRPI